MRLDHEPFHEFEEPHSSIPAEHLAARKQTRLNRLLRKKTKESKSPNEAVIRRADQYEGCHGED